MRTRAKEGGIRKAANLTKTANLVNLAIFRRKFVKSQISPNSTKVRWKHLDLRERAKEGGIRKATKLTETGIWRYWRFDESSPERLRSEEASERGGHQQSGEFDENGELGEIGDLTKVCRKHLDLRERAKEGGIRKAANLTKTANLVKLAIFRRKFVKSPISPNSTKVRWKHLDFRERAKEGGGGGVSGKRRN